MEGNEPRYEKIRFGGLFRCCIETLGIKRSIEEQERDPAKAGDTIQCEQCHEWVVFDGDTWKWDSEYTERRSQL